MIGRLLIIGVALAPLFGGCAAVAVTGAVVGGTAKLASTAVGTTVSSVGVAADLVIPDGDEEKEPE